MENPVLPEEKNGAIATSADADSEFLLNPVQGDVWFMDVELITGLILNVALLITLSAVYEAFSFKLPDGIQRRHGAVFSWVSGIILAAMVLAVMNTHFHAAQGVFIDSRSILISLGALFFGAIPALIAAGVAMTFRAFLGGAGTLAGEMIILSSLGIGLFWRWRFRNREYQIPPLDLYAMNFLVHVAMVLSMWLFLPAKIHAEVTRDLALPILVLFPLVGFMLSRQIQSQIKQKLVQQKLHETGQFFQKLFEDSHLVMLLIDPDTGKIIQANRTAVGYYGWPEAELMKKRIQDINTLSPDVVKQRMEEARSLGKTHFDFKHYMADGSIRDVEVYTGTLQKEGRELIYSVILDVSERNEAQRALIQERERSLRQTQKEEQIHSLGVLAGGIAHDFNNILGGLFGYIELAQDDENMSEETREYLSKALESFERAKGLSSQMLTFSKGGNPLRHRTNLTAVLESVVRFASKDSHVKVHLQVERGLWDCEADEPQISQVFDNLILNSRQFLATGGDVWVSAANVELDDHSVPGVRAGSWVRIRVADSGPGVPDEIRQKIFDPFFTTRHNGNGLGLSTAFSIVQKHEGRLLLDEEYHEGAAFLIFLPAMAVVPSNGEPDTGHHL